jgi:shikimate dehydrogenase
LTFLTVQYIFVGMTRLSGGSSTARIDGSTRIIAHVGFPTESFKAPLIYNPYFASIGRNVAVIPMGVRAEDFAGAFPAIMRLSNIDGALITMPHKISVTGMLVDASTAVRIAGSCNAVRRRADGGLEGDMFDGEGFVRGLRRKGCPVAGASALVVGAGGVGSAIAASLAAAGIARIALHDVDAKAMQELAARLAEHFPALAIACGSSDPFGFDIVVNATPLGMRDDDPLPLDVSRVAPGAMVGEVVMTRETTPLIAAARARGCRTQVGLDMLYEMIPAYLEFFGLPTTTPERLRALAGLGNTRAA